ncbi:uncharacterized protein LOC144650710 [Oculina patagonica]
MRLGLTCAIISLVSFCIMTQHRTSAAMEETLEEGREYREDRKEEKENGAANNGGAVGWRRRRNVIEMNPSIDERTAKSFEPRVK